MTVWWPTGRHPLRLAELSDRPPGAMEFVRASVRSSRLPAPPARVRSRQEEPVKRRAFLTASTAATPHPRARAGSGMRPRAVMPALCPGYGAPTAG